MFKTHSTMKQNQNFPVARRDGVVAVLFAFVLPVLLILAAVAINLSYMQLTRTELKLATDASARAGGRAWSEFNDVDEAKEFARRAASLNEVGGSPLLLSTDESAGEIVFGESARGGDGRFAFTPTTEAQIANNGLASGLQINATHPTLLFFEIGGTSSFTPSASSIATQIERDIALIVDKSASMFSFQGQITNPEDGEDYLYEVMTDLYEDPANGITRAEYFNSIADYQGLQEAADMSTRARIFTDKILDLLPEGDLKTYALTLNSDYRSSTAPPRFSRWHSLELANDAFFDVLAATEQTELVSIASFNRDAQLEIPLTSDLDAAGGIVGEIFPTGSTAIGKGMLEGFDALNGDAARQSAVKTIIVLSDGLNKQGISPVNAAQQIIGQNPSTVIHTVTLGAEADIDEMAEVARIGSGKHYHATNTMQLIEVFQELAASHRTLITD